MKKTKLSPFQINAIRYYAATGSTDQFRLRKTGGLLTIQAPRIKLSVSNLQDEIIKQVPEGGRLYGTPWNTLEYGADNPIPFHHKIPYWRREAIEWFIEHAPIGAEYVNPFSMLAQADSLYYSIVILNHTIDIMAESFIVINRDPNIIIRGPIFWKEGELMDKLRVVSESTGFLSVKFGDRFLVSIAKKNKRFEFPFHV